MKIDCPGKTFLLGEYCVLTGGPSLIVTHAPCFSLTVTESESPLLEGIHPNSPAGLLYMAHQDLLKHYHIAFTDPYNSIGGLGASSAEFLSLYNAINVLSSKQPSLNTLLNTYWQYAYQNKGIKPSGADIVAQSNGGLCYFHRNENECISYAWPFQTLSLFLIHTKNKLSTHHHLETLKLPKQTSPLNDIVNHAKNAIDNKDSLTFVECINLFSKGLLSAGLVAPHTQSILTELKAIPEIIASKGAGAMGADMVIVLCQTTHEKSVLSALNKLSYPIIASSKSLYPPVK